jgi:hypothetical protein
MPSPSRAYAAISRHLVRHRRRDLLVELHEARDAIGSLATVITIAERQADAPTVVWLKTESMRARARFEHALHRTIEEISEGDGGDLVAELLGGDNRTLAQILLDGE